MERDFNTPKDGPTPEDIWDFSQNFEPLYKEGCSVRTSSDLEDFVRHAISEFNAAQDVYGSIRYNGSSKSVLDYFESMRQVF